MKHARVLPALVISLLVVLAACSGPQPPAGAPPSPCLTGSPGQDCVGITDGTDNLTGDKQFDPVHRAVKRENDRVAALGPTVSIVYAVPVPRVPSLLSTQLREELEGAHLMQLRANDATSDVAGKPYVRILIADMGEGSEGWKPVVERIRRMAADTTAPGHVVAVAGLGTSLDTVRSAMTALSQPPVRIPMVPARLTADGISPAPGSDGVFRVAAPNSTQAVAAATYLTTACRAALVQDVRPDDLYLKDVTTTFPTLVTATGARAGSCAGGSDQLLPAARYDSSLDGVDNALQNRIPDICQRNPDTVYFGGRGANFGAFIAALGSRDKGTCPGPITVVTNSDGLGLASEIRDEIRTNAAPTYQNALRSGIRIVVTGLASPGEWPPDAASEPSLAALAGTCVRCLATVFPGETTDDGDVIMGHDAVLTVVKAIRAGVTQQQQTVGAGDVLQGLLGFGPSRPVAGASGPIGFDPQGRPITKNVPILGIDERGAITYLGSR